MKLRNVLLAVSGAAFSLAAMAAGDHAGGHAGDAIGRPGVAAQVTRMVNVDMSDAMRFKSPRIAVKQGETVRFVVKNSGRLKHEMVLGTQKDLKEHSEAMKKNPEMEHADADMVAVAPGKSGEIVWQFTQAGKVDFACLQPGHYDAGMKGLVNVSTSNRAALEDAASAAQTPVGQGQAQAALKPDGSAATSDMVEGEVRKVDREARTVTLRHGEIKNLEMPPMSMVFRVKDAAMLDAVKTGDRVRFKAEKANGAIIATEIQTAR